MTHWVDEIDGVTYVDKGSHIGLFDLIDLAKQNLTSKEYEHMVKRVLDIRDINKAIRIINEYMPYPFKFVA